MESDDRRRERLRALLESQRLAVLATHREVLFATTRSTRKYENITADARVALLIDNRSNQDSDIHEATAVTATGRADEIEGADKERFLRLYLERHPYLQDFVNSPTCALLRVRVETYYLVNRFQEVTELHAEKWI